MKTLLKIFLVIILVIVVLIFLLMVILSFAPAVPNDYIKKVDTGGKIETTYLKMGSYDVDYMKYEGSELTKSYTMYYPKELEINDKKYPAIIVLNGTGVLQKKSKTLFKHLASWGFIVIGNDDPSTGNGKSTDETLEFILSLNENQNDIFYHHIDLDKIGLTGHSQGGAGVFSALSISKYKDYYRTAVSLSPTHEETAHAFGWAYDLSKINVPIFMLAGTKGDFETKHVLPLNQMIDMFHKIPSNKVMARRIEAEHGQMLYFADGYVTAWFMYYLQDKKEAGNFFIGDQLELMNNPLYINQHIHINKS